MSKAKLKAYNLWDGISMKRSGMRGATGGEGVEGLAWPEDMAGLKSLIDCFWQAQGVAARVSVR